MNAPIKHQIIREGGKPLFVLVPYKTYLETMHKIEAGDEVSQKDMARRLSISQSAYSQMEKPGAQLRPATLDKIAAALEIDPEQLDF